MTARTFKLPRIQDLSKEQEQARALPLTDQHLIIGGPGTGKSVLTLLRARRLAAEKVEYQFLVFNRLLNRSNIQLFGAPLASKTWQNWFNETFQSITGDRPPRLVAQDVNGFEDYDWKRIEQKAKEMEKAPDFATPSNRLLLVIDEGQDMPPQFYETLKILGFEHFFVAADQNQQITKSCSSREEIEDALALEPNEVVELRQNYRNSFPVWRLAREFYTDPASPLSEPPNRNTDSVALLITYSPERLPDVARRIVKRVRNRPDRLIGVIAPNNAVRERYIDALQAVKRSDCQQGEDFPLETFHRGHEPNVRFDRGGILVINVQACKGLEFDEVVCADIDGYFVNPEDDSAVKKLFYVMVARARQAVFLLMRQDGNQAIARILPEDKAVLQRHSIGVP